MRTIHEIKLQRNLTSQSIMLTVLCTKQSRFIFEEIHLKEKLFGVISLLVCYLHENFQWIGRELALLQNRIDRANEKGWRREYPFVI